MIPNPSFSTKLPLLQLAIDSTSLGTFKECPRKYYYNIICGYVPHRESVHLTFGLLLHAAVERYHRWRTPFQKFQGVDHDEALFHVVKWAMRESWPWKSDDKTKNRFTLIRTIIWYLDAYKDDYIKTLTLSNGRPAVELSFHFDSGYKSQATEEPFQLCGHLDRLGKISNSTYISDVKTTGSTINDRWFDRFTPDNQMTLYAIAGKVAFGVETEGIVIDGCQVTITGFVERGSPFNRGIVPRSAYQLEEWHDDLGYHLSNLERCASKSADYGILTRMHPGGAPMIEEKGWPQNDKACNLYGGCPYRAVCYGPSASYRQQVLDTQYTIRQWNPLEKRGDI